MAIWLGISAFSALVLRHPRWWWSSNRASSWGRPRRLRRPSCNQSNLENPLMKSPLLHPPGGSYDGRPVLSAVLCSAQADDEGEIASAAICAATPPGTWTTTQELSGNDRGRLSMLREARPTSRPIPGPARLRWKIAGRAVRQAAPLPLRPAGPGRSRGAFANPASMLDRHLQLGADPRGLEQSSPPRTSTSKFGRQQVVWGETDIFQAST